MATSTKEKKASKSSKSSTSKASSKPTASESTTTKRTREEAAETRGDALVASSGTTTTQSEHMGEGAPPGDLDVADLSKKHYKGEREPELTLESWVRLGNHEDVPEKLVGHIAGVTDIPKKFDVETGDWVQDFDKPVRVQTRDEAQTVLYLPLEAFDEISTTGRAGLLHHA